MSIRSIISDSFNSVANAFREENTVFFPPSSRSASSVFDFVKYCAAHPEERFWQALRNWSGYAFVVVVKEKDREAYEKAGYPFEDTFNIK